MVDDFLFSGDNPEPEQVKTIGKWKVLVVDDEPEVHAVTKLALSDFLYQEKTIEFMSAYSGAEARDIIRDNNDIAIVLLDVVMETDDAGLNVANYIRNELKNKNVRIILRTGQPGQAPEKQVILNYDINDYKSKTELTAQKLFTVVLSGLRSYRDLRSLEQSHEGLKKIISASADIFNVHSMEQFIDGVMQQLTSVLGCGEEQAMYATDSFMINCPSRSTSKDLTVVAAQGQFADYIGHQVSDVDVIKSSQLQEAFSQAILSRSIVYQDNYLIAYCHSKFSTNSLLFVSGLPSDLSDTHRDLVELFAKNVQIAFESIQLKVELESSQTELLERLGGAIEKRLNDAGGHIRNVVALTGLLASWYGLEESEIEMLKKAAPLHDIGKISLPDTLLKKQSELTDDEWEQVKKSPLLGHEILKGSNSEIIQFGSTIAYQHYENWDGSGYPKGLKGKDIHIFARIVKVANVYDSLRTALIYKGDWSHDQAMQYLKEKAGIEFDPGLIDLVETNHQKFEAVFKS